MSNTSALELRVNSSSFLLLTLPRAISCLTHHDFYQAELYWEGKRYPILDGSKATDLFGTLRWRLAELLAGNMKLHASIEAGKLGYLRGKWIQEAGSPPAHGSQLVMEEEGPPLWVGLRYYLWGSKATGVASWIYEREESYFLELTSTSLDEKERDFVAETFQKPTAFPTHYKPLLFVELTHSVLARWLRQVEKVEAVLEANARRHGEMVVGESRERRRRRIGRLIRTRKRR